MPFAGRHAPRERRPPTARLAAAHDLVTCRRYEDAVSRAYYAAFHAATATLLSLGIESKTHGGLRALFALHVVRPGLVA